MSGSHRNRPLPPRSPAPALQRGNRLLAECGEPRVPTGGDDESAQQNLLATRLMDLYRRTGSSEVFEGLVQLTSAKLMARVRSRIRFLGDHLDPNELLQDAIINIYRYPDKFDASRPTAFQAWSSTIVDNTIRRHMRRMQSGPDVALRPAEILAQYPDLACREPGRQAQDSEDYENAVSGFRLFLCFYLCAFQTLSERERFVLQMVEVRRMRYADLAGLLGIRPEALKMVVFRARKRIAERIAKMMIGGLRRVPETPPRRRPEAAADLALAC